MPKIVIILLNFLSNPNLAAHSDAFDDCIGPIPTPYSLF
jgi:hypothetical protein